MSARRFLPGLVVLCLGAVLARGIELVLGANHLLVAIGLGFVLANAVGVPDRLEPGIATHKLWLGAGIVLMGASLTLDTLLEAGVVVVAVIALVTGSTIVVVELLSRNVFGLADRLGSLLAAGSGICGVSAIVAVGGAIRARESQVAYAAATVLLFDAVTIVVFPIVGDVLELSGTVFGIWAGVSMFSTGPVVAVGFAHSDVAGQWATVTKLARNALIGVVVLGYAGYYARSADGSRPTVPDALGRISEVRPRLSRARPRRHGRCALLTSSLPSKMPTTGCSCSRSSVSERRSGSQNSGRRDRSPFSSY